MEIQVAQKDVQRVFIRGSVGQMVSGIIWMSSAALGTWVSEKHAIVVLVLGGMLIFPLTRLILFALRKPSGLPQKHPFNTLAMLVAFIVPLNLPVIGAATQFNINWFYPAFMLIVGTHYLPFVHLYGMWEYGLLAGILICGGLTIGLLLPGVFTIGGWITGGVLVLFSLCILLFQKEKGVRNRQNCWLSRAVAQNNAE